MRIREYAGLEPGHVALTEILKERTTRQMAKPGVLYPAKAEMDTELSRNSNYIDGISTLMRKYGLTGWEEPFATLSKQLTDYDAWLRATVLPKARTDFRIPPEEYALALEGFGIDIPPAQLAVRARQAFIDIQAEMIPIASQIARSRHLPSSNYRDVIRELKKQQLVGDAILPFFESRLKEIEKIIVEQKLVSLPERPASIRIATAAETAQQPAPHMQAPPFLRNTGERGAFVLPLNVPAGAGQTESQKYDDFAFDAASWTLTAHEARPGHELQFDSMLEHGVSLARVRYALEQHERGGVGSVCGVHPEAVHAARGTAHLARLPAPSGGAGVSRSRAAGRKGHARGRLSRARGGRRPVPSPSRRRRSSASPIARPGRPAATSTGTPG